MREVNTAGSGSNLNDLLHSSSSEKVPQHCDPVSQAPAALEAPHGSQPYGNAEAQRDNAAARHPAIADFLNSGTTKRKHDSDAAESGASEALQDAKKSKNSGVSASALRDNSASESTASSANSAAAVPTKVKPRRLLPTSAPALSKTAQTSAAVSSPPLTNREINEEILKNAPIKLSSDHKTILRNFGKFLDEHRGGLNLTHILESGQSAYGNPHVQAWLDADGETNPYGRNTLAMKAKAGNRGGAAVTALLKSYGKHH